MALKDAPWISLCCFFGTRADHAWAKDPPMCSLCRTGRKKHSRGRVIGPLVPLHPPSFRSLIFFLGGGNGQEGGLGPSGRPLNPPLMTSLLLHMTINGRTLLQQEPIICRETSPRIHHVSQFSQFGSRRHRPALRFPTRG